MKSKFNVLLAAAALGLGGLVSGAAVAAPISQLYFTQDAGWLNPTDADPTTYVNSTAFQPTTTNGFTLSMQNPTGTDAPAGTSGQMRWTDQSGNYSGINLSTYSSNAPLSPNSASSVSISSGVPVLGDTNGNNQWNPNEYWAISTLTQVNNVIYGNFPNPLWVADVSANLRIFGDAGRTINAFSDLGSKTNISFWETVNYTPNPSVPGSCYSPDPLLSVCDDVYTVSLFDFADESFFYNGQWVTLGFTLFPGDANTLICSSAFPDAACTGAYPGAGQIAVYTRENQNSTIHIAMAYFVPEPSMLSLVGLALLGLGFASRRRQA